MIEPVEERVRTNAIELNVAVWRHETATEPPIVLLHGIWDTWRIFSELGSRLAKSRTVYAPDLRGHGKSDKPEAGYRYSDYAADISALIGGISEGEVDVMGFSMGVPIAAMVAIGSARTRKLVLEDPPLQPRAGSRAAAERWLGIKTRPYDEVVAAMRATYPTRSDALVEENARTLMMTARGALESIAHGEQDVDWPPTLVELEAPTLILQADPACGGLLTDENRTRLMSFVRRSEVAQFAGCGHSIHGERCEDLFRIVDGFLTRRD